MKTTTYNVIAVIPRYPPVNWQCATTDSPKMLLIVNALLIELAINRFTKNTIQGNQAIPITQPKC